jgi:hypothetical protein
MKIPMSHEGNVSEKPIMGMQWVQKYHWSMRDLIYPSFAGTRTRVKLLAKLPSAFCHRVRTIRNVVFGLVRMIRPS